MAATETTAEEPATAEVQTAATSEMIPEEEATRGAPVDAAEMEVEEAAVAPVEEAAVAAVAETAAVAEQAPAEQGGAMEEDMEVCRLSLPHRLFHLPLCPPLCPPR